MGKRVSLKMSGYFEGKRDVQKEIDTFLAALSSYPDRFAKDPALSFERHLIRMTADSQAEAADTRD